MDTSPGPGPGSAAPEPEDGGAPTADHAPVDLPDGGDEAGAGHDGADEYGVTDGDAHGDDDGDDDGADDGDDDEDPGPHDPLRFNQWMKRSAAGAVLSGIALGLQQALEPKRAQPAFVMEAPGEPEDPDAQITLRFDPDDPTRTVAVVRARALPDERSSGPVPPDPSGADPPDAIDS